MSRLWRTNEGGKWKIEQYSGRPETAIKHYVSLLRCFWGGIKDYDDDCADIEIRQFCGCQPASIWLNGFYITTSSSSSFHPPPTHIPTFCRMAKFNITWARIDYLLVLWKRTVTNHPAGPEPLNCGYILSSHRISSNWASLHIQPKQFKHRFHEKSRKVCSVHSILNSFCDHLGKTRWTSHGTWPCWEPIWGDPDSLKVCWGPKLVVAFVEGIPEDVRAKAIKSLFCFNFLKWISPLGRL